MSEYQGCPAPDYTAAFKHARPIPPGHAGADLPGHRMLCDPELYELCGYATLDEASILYNLTRRFPGRWLEIGAHTGWTSCYLAGDHNDVTCLEPEFGTARYNVTGDPARFLARWWENTESAIGFLAACQLTPWSLHSHDFLNGSPVPRYDGILIDGEHAHACRDAMLVLPWLKPGGVIVLHDGLHHTTQAALRWLESEGYPTRIFNTYTFLMAATRRPDLLPRHFPDSSVDWVARRNVYFASPTDVIDADIAEAAAWLAQR